MKLNEIRDNAGAHKRRMRIGRGIGSGKGKTGGRGGKGQTARTGVRMNGFEGGQTPIYRRLPKRGFVYVFRRKWRIVNLGDLQKAVEAGRLDAKKPVDTAALAAAGLIRRSGDGVRLLAKGELKVPLSIVVAGASGPAKAAIEKLGGKLELTEPVEPPAETKS
jgi:large subunit ribosomal protein L15